MYYIYYILNWLFLWSRENEKRLIFPLSALAVLEINSLVVFFRVVHKATLLVWLVAAVQHWKQKISYKGRMWIAAFKLFHRVHRVTQLQYQKQRLHSSCFGEEVCANQLSQDQSMFTKMWILFLGCFFPFESLRRGSEYSTSGKILLFPLQNVKLKSKWGYTTIQPW